MSKSICAFFASEKVYKHANRLEIQCLSVKSLLILLFWIVCLLLPNSRATPHWNLVNVNIRSRVTKITKTLNNIFLKGTHENRGRLGLEFFAEFRNNIFQSRKNFRFLVKFVNMDTFAIIV